MNREEIMIQLSKIENNLPVYDWKVDEIDVWPILKWILFEQLSTPKNDITDKKANAGFIIKLKTIVYKNIRLLKSFKALLSLNYLPKSETVFLSAKTYRVNFNNEFINRYFEPLKRNFKSFTLIEHHIDNKLSYPEPIIIDLAAFNAYLNFKNKFILKQKSIYLKEFDKLFTFLPTHIDVDQLEDTFKQRVNLIQNLIPIYHKILTITKPNVVYGLCYYSPMNFAFYYAANKLGIPNYDIQHGGQGSLHAMYTFRNLPNDRRINTLPERFWVWDTESLNHLKSWLPSNLNYAVENKGNLWWDYAIQNLKTTTELTHKRIILYTLQFKSLDDYIIEAIDKTPDDYIWFIRTHPRIPESKQVIKKQLTEKNLLNKVDLENASEFPLPVILNRSFIHISKFSGSIIEADQLGVKTIMLEETGIKTFPEIIAKGNAFPLLNPTSEQIMKIILTHKINL